MDFSHVSGERYVVALAPSRPFLPTLSHNLSLTSISLLVGDRVPLRYFVAPVFLTRHRFYSFLRSSPKPQPWQLNSRCVLEVLVVIALAVFAHLSFSSSSPLLYGTFLIM